MAGNWSDQSRSDEWLGCRNAQARVNDRIWVLAAEGASTSMPKTLAAGGRHRHKADVPGLGKAEMKRLPKTHLLMRWHETDRPSGELPEDYLEGVTPK